MPLKDWIPATGAPVAYVGEDGAMFVMGHVDPRLAECAFAVRVRVDSDETLTAKIGELKYRWVVEVVDGPTGDVYLTFGSEDTPGAEAITYHPGY